jgi:hypothetical protein
MYRLLTNPTFIGVRTFKVNGVEQTSKACWDPIIDEETFHKAQALLKKNHRRNKRAMNSRYPFQLSGLVACGTCGGRMPGKSAHGKKLKIPYYAHGWTTVRAAVNDDAKHRCTGPERILANIVEPLVWEKVVNLLSDPFRAKRIVDEAKRLYAPEGPRSGSRTIEF